MMGFGREGDDPIRQSAMLEELGVAGYRTTEGRELRAVTAHGLTGSTSAPTSAIGRPASQHSKHRRFAFFFSCELENAATGLGLWHAPHTLVGPAAAAVAAARAPGCVTGLVPTDSLGYVVGADDTAGGAAACGGGVQYFLCPPSFQCSRWCSWVQ